MKSHTKLLSLTTLLLLLAGAIPSFALGADGNQNSELQKNNDGYYLIGSDAAYEAFRQMVATGNPYANAQLTANITATQPIGSGDPQFHYRGTFDGQGYTIKLKNMTNPDNQPWGLFQYTEPGCVIKNLNVTDTISSEGKYMGSIVGQATGTVLENCSSTVILTNDISYSDDKLAETHIGGLIGVGYGKNFLKNCSFDGHLEGPAFTYHRLIGHNPHVVCIEDCSSDGDGYITRHYVFQDVQTGKVYVDDMGYDINTNDKTAILQELKHVNTNVSIYDGPIKAIHVPESFVLNDVTYTVKKIGNNAFKDSPMEYCYIPKTITHIEDDAFKGCNQLKYLHIADCPSAGTSSLYIGHKNNKYAMFEDCPLQKVYIGRDLRWYTESDGNPDEPFERNKVTDVFFGPRVSRIGNYQNKDAREGWSYDLFNDCEHIERVYIMGDEQSLNEAQLEVYCEDGLDDATDYYVNHTININGDTKEHIAFEDNGIFKNCENVTFGPFNKTVGNTMFGYNGQNILKHNDKLKTVDFTNVTRLVKIDKLAFAKCYDTVFTGLDGQYPLKTVGDEAFYRCEKLEYIDLGSQLESIGESAFDECKTLNFITIPGTVTSIGEDAFEDCESLQGVTFEAGSTELNINQLYGRFSGTKNIASLHLNRNFSGVPKNPSLVGEDSPFDPSDGTLTSLTIGPEVTHLERGLFYGLNKISSVNFEYSAEPLVFTGSGRRSDDTYVLGSPQWVFDIDKSGTLIDNNPISSLRIDRVLHDDNGSELTGNHWGNARELVTDITFGEHVDHVAEAAFDGFVKLNTLMFSPTIKTIGNEAFRKAEKLGTISFMGPTAIGKWAFMNCYNLKTIIVGDDRLTVGIEAFANCDQIEEIIINSDGNSAESSADGFSRDAYANATIYSTYDTSTLSVEFKKDPWKLFGHHPFKRDNDYLNENRQNDQGVYEHASIKLDINEGQYELFYAPFQWDSYYFGSDAEIYSLPVDGESYAETSSKSGDITSYNIGAQRIDIQNTIKLPKGVYAVKTNYPAQTLSATRNLFVEHDGIDVDNTSQTSTSEYENTLAYGNRSGNVTDPLDGNAYVIEDGAIKKLNGTYTVKDGSVILSSRYFGDRDVEAFNINDNANTIFTSKRSIPFNEHLEGYATFYNEKYNVLAPEWCDVYVVTCSDNGSIHLEKITDRIINAGQAVIIKTKHEAAIGAEDFMTYVTNGSTRGATLYSQNLLRGVGQSTEVSTVSGGAGYVYVLSCNSNHTNTGFYKYSDGKTLAAGKAYLLPSSFNSEAKSCLFAFKDVVTGVDNVGIYDSERPSAYDLSGRRIDASTSTAKGIYIINNKKVVK